MKGKYTRQNQVVWKPEEDLIVYFFRLSKKSLIYAVLIYLNGSSSKLLKVLHQTEWYKLKRVITKQCK